MRLRYTQPALSDLDAILEYIAIHSPSGAARVHTRIQTIIDLLLSHPPSGCEPTIQRSNDPARQHVALSLFDIYEIADQEIIIHAVRHGARDPSGRPGAS